MTEELEVLKIVTGRLESAGIPYMVTGSIAANYYAVPRMTRDIDIVIQVSSAGAHRLSQLFRDDFYVEPDAVGRAIAERTTFNVIHTAFVVKVDFVVRKDSEYRREEFRRRRRVTIDDMMIFVVAPEDLIISKLDWARDTRSEVQLADTPPEMERKYREMLLQRSGAERLKMGCSMFATARALVVASVLEKEPSASPARVRRALFLRFYGADFGAGERERIAAWLGRDEEERRAAMTPRKVPVDWDGLAVALTANPDEWTCYLDVRSGEVQMVPVDRFGDDDWPSEEEIDAGLEAGHLIHVDPLGPSVEYGWMAEFASSVGDAGLRDRLEVALDGRGPFRRFKNVLLPYPAERERWFAFQAERVREAVREWLAEHGIEPTTVPPASR